MHKKKKLSWFLEAPLVRQADGELKKSKAPLCSGNRGTLQIEQRRLLTRRSHGPSSDMESLNRFSH